MKTACRVCGVWVCSGCGWSRRNASRFGKQDCFACGGERGVMQPVVHQNEWKQRDHEDILAAGLTATYPL